jgi:glutathione S-transferase
MKLYAHPFSSYCQKVLIALYEKHLSFEMRLLGSDETIAREHEALWPLKKMPVLVDEGRTYVEASIIVEHLDLVRPGASPLIPRDARAALEVRFMDRFFDNYVMMPMQKIVFDRLRSPDQRDPAGVADARAMLDTAYGWLDRRIGESTYATGDTFTLADCAAAPSLFYADWVHPIAPQLANVRAYRQRLLERPSFARAVDEARPYRANFPLGAPERD